MEGLKMKHPVITALIVGALAIAGAYSKVAASGPRIDRATVEFRQPVTLQGHVLKGRYLVLHHEGLMQQGKACTYFYTLDGEIQGKLVASFHCTPVVREKVAQFIVRMSSDNPAGVTQILEVQFPGTAEGHRVPVS
jgi:hypothetical protein